MKSFHFPLFRPVPRAPFPLSGEQKPVSAPPLVLHIIDDLGLGGAQRQMVELLKGLDRKRYAVEVISLSTVKSDYEQAIRDLGIPLTLIPQSGKWSWSAFSSLVKALRVSQPEIVQTWLFTADLYGRLAAKLTKVPHVVSTVRSVEPDKPWHYVQADRLLKGWTDRFIVNAEAIGEVLARREGVRRDRITVIYNGLDLKILNPAQVDGVVRKNMGIREQLPVVGIVGRLAPVKDHETFLRAAAIVAQKLPEISFLVVGNGPLKKQLRQLGRQLGLEARLHFMESQSDVAEIYAALDLLVVSSVYEGCCNVILEAMAMGKPVVATAVGGNPELVIPGRTGLLVPAKDPESLAEAVVDLLSDPARVREMGLHARRRIEERFNLSRMVDETEQVYEKLLSAPGGTEA